MRHDDRAGDTAQPCCERQRLAVVAAGMGDHAAGRAIIGKAEHGVRRAAELEGARALHRFALEVQGAASEGIHRAAGHDRRAVHEWRDALQGTLDVAQAGSMHTAQANCVRSLFVGAAPDERFLEDRVVGVKIDPEDPRQRGHAVSQVLQGRTIALAALDGEAALT